MPETTDDDYFGLCPTCNHTDGSFNAGKAHWFVCHEHQVRWFVGSNLFSAWRDQTEDQQRYAYEVDPGWGAYQEVEPYYYPRPMHVAVSRENTDDVPF